MARVRFAQSHAPGCLGRSFDRRGSAKDARRLTQSVETMGCKQTSCFFSQSQALAARFLGSLPNPRIKRQFHIITQLFTDKYFTLDRHNHFAGGMSIAKILSTSIGGMFRAHRTVFVGDA